MLFNSLEFIFLFLPLTLLGYFLVAGLTRHSIYSLLFLACASLAFYAYWDTRFLPVILTSIILNYLFGLALGRENGSPAVRRLIFTIAIIANLGALGFCKYFNFGLQIWSKLSGHQHAALELILPLGISFFTFTQIAYLADVFSGHPKEESFVKYLLFVTYFPHLIAGPILHHKEMMPQFSVQAGRRFSSENLALGLTVFAIGLFKKAIIADSFSHIANPVFQAIAHHVVPAQDAWGGALAYALQIYFDFSGYSDMAVGLSIMFGIQLPFNFDAPYQSRSMIEFWRRWHITLSRFLRDYLYISLGGNQRGKLRRYINLLLTMILGGLWHGAGWTYIAWGYLHGCYLMINHGWKKTVEKRPFLKRISLTLPYSLLSLLLTQLAVVVAWVYFRADNIKEAHYLLGAMFHIGPVRSDLPSLSTAVTPLHWAVIAVVYLSCLLLPNVRAIFDQWPLGLQTYENKKYRGLLSLKWRLGTGWAILTAILLLVSIFAILVAGDGTQFLYFQF